MFSSLVCSWDLKVLFHVLLLPTEFVAKVFFGYSSKYLDEWNRNEKLYIETI